MAHAVDRCVQCGQSDDHPKFHLADKGEVRSFHHDCLPADVREAHADHPMVPRIIAAAESGVRGHELRRHIAELHGEG
ncbi:MAG: hypothetical protein ACXV3F_00335 [Frankiaceae bacterium]